MRQAARNTHAHVGRNENDHFGVVRLWSLLWGGEDSDIVLRGGLQEGGIRPGRIRGGVEMDQETGKAEAGMQTFEGEAVCDWRGWKPRSRRSRRGGR